MKYVAITILTLILAGIFTCSYIFVKHEMKIMKPELHCGTVMDLENHLKNVKHGTKTDFYLKINFDSVGIKVLAVSPETYFTKNKGDSICLYLNKKILGEADNLGIEGIIGAFGLVLFAAASVTLVCSGFYILIDIALSP